MTTHDTDDATDDRRSLPATSIHLAPGSTRPSASTPTAPPPCGCWSSTPTGTAANIPAAPAPAAPPMNETAGYPQSGVSASACSAGG
jgi:hypothetical protein